MRLLCNLIIILFPCLCIGALVTERGSEKVFLAADLIEYNSNENYIYGTGNIKIQFNEYILTSNNLIYDIEKDQLWAQGSVRVQDQKSTVALGESAIFKDKLKSGIIKNFILKFNDNTIVASKLAKRIDKNHTALYLSTFTPCQIPCSGNPIWQISSKETLIDYEKEKMIYKNIFFEVYGIPIFFTPYFSHPLPSAQAKSGILIPKIEKGSFSLPLYLRIKPNMDLTLTPRVTQTYFLNEVEFRHKISAGYYQIVASHGYVPYKNAKVNSGFISSYGDFSTNNYQYGFNLSQAFDKAYLKNYYEIYNSFLNSRLYFTNIYGLNYLNIEGLHFQGLRIENSSRTDPWIFPKIRIKNVFNLNDSGNIYFTIKDDSLVYVEPQQRVIFKNSLDLSLTNNLTLSSGQLLTLIVRTIEDLYTYKNIPEHMSKKQISYFRTIPEIQAILRHPFTKTISYNKNAIVEPIVSLTFGRKQESTDKMFKLIDSSKSEITENNFFTSNHYSGTDYHEFGHRLNYGINMAFLSSENYYTLFIGQYLHTNNINSQDRKGNVGKLAANLVGNIELFYRYRKNESFKSIRDEIGSNIWYKKLQLSFNFIKLSNIKKYFSDENFSLTANKAIQAQYAIEYSLNTNWTFSHKMHLDISKKRINPLNKTIRVTYFKDCVKISLKLYDNYTSDPNRGIKQVHSKTVALGLKILNM